MDLSLTAHRLELTLEAVTAIELNEHQGAALRGALFEALRATACTQRQTPDCAACPLAGPCPVALLVSTLDPQAERGRDVPRPFVIEPPLDGRTRLAPGERLSFGLTLFAGAMQLFPYVIIALRSWEETGLGKRVLAQDGRRGRARLAEALATNPLTGARLPVYRPGEKVRVQDAAITAAHIAAALSTWPTDRLTLRFLTPTRLIDGGALLRRPTFAALFHRLWWRLADLERYFANATPGRPPHPLTDAEQEAKYRLVALAQQVRTAHDETRWVELESYSARQRRTTPISGFVGQVEFAGDLAPFLPWIAWGQLCHVGKDAVKGNGWYRVEDAGAPSALA